MDCVYNRNYPTLTYDAETSYKIISETEFNTYENYFTNIQEFTSIKDVYTANVLSNLTEEEISIMKIILMVITKSPILYLMWLKKTIYPMI